MHIDVNDETDTLSSDKIHLLQRLLTFAAEQEDVPQDAEVSLNFVNRERIKQLNATFRYKNEVTDVISFAMQEHSDEEIAIQENPHLPYVLGDIIISVEQAQEQAQRYNHSFEREIGFLTVHGFLHLLGYSHETKIDEDIMFRRQEVILSEFGLER